MTGADWGRAWEAAGVAPAPRAASVASVAVVHSELGDLSIRRTLFTPAPGTRTRFLPGNLRVEAALARALDAQAATVDVDDDGSIVVLLLEAAAA